MGSHRIVVNSAVCGRCADIVESPGGHQACRCGYLTIDGGFRHLVRVCQDAPEDEQYRDFLEISVLSTTYHRRGLVVEAFQTDTARTVTGPDGRTRLAAPGDYVVFEPEGGLSAWSPQDFHVRHETQ